MRYFILIVALLLDPAAVLLLLAATLADALDALCNPKVAQWAASSQCP
jgi:hypothetical protein